MEIQDYKILFLQKSLLGQRTKFEEAEEVIFKCIKLAYRDMLTVGRFYILNDANNTSESRYKKLKSILEKNNYVYHRNIIEEILPLFGDKEEIRNHTNDRFVTRYGLAQKFVNMTYKYFYVFNDYIKKEIDFSNCDCPLDSVILRKNPELKGYTWSKLTKEDYEFCQKIISERLQEESLNNELKLLGNLAFDFKYW